MLHFVFVFVFVFICILLALLGLLNLFSLAARFYYRDFSDYTVLHAVGMLIGLAALVELVLGW